VQIQFSVNFVVWAQGAWLDESKDSQREREREMRRHKIKGGE